MKGLVFSAAGGAGTAYIGVVRSLEERGLMKQIRSVRGISSGALIASMLSVGMTHDEMYDLTASVEPLKPITRCATLSKLVRFRKTMGLGDIAGDLGPLMDAYLPRSATFRDLRDGPDLSTYAYNVTSGSLVTMNRHTTPDANVRDAILASCCIPFYFRPVQMDGDLYVDGAVARRTPEFIVEDGDVAIDVDMRPTLGSRPMTIDRYIDAVVMGLNRTPAETPGLVTVTCENASDVIGDGYRAMELYLCTQHIGREIRFSEVA